MIEVKHLSKIYGSTTAIKDVDFSVETGEILGFLGPNGAGKTTTMRILSGYLPATTGTAIIDGYDVHEQSMEVRRRIGYLPETPPLYPDMTVEGFLNFVARLKGIASGDRRERINYAVENCQLEDKRKVLIRKLSKGYKQRVGIAQAIVHDPPAIILDEPTVGLDPKQIIEVRNLIKNLAGQHTIILSTHILPEVSMTCDRVTIINSGRVVATDTPDNLMSHLQGSSGYEIEVMGEIGDLADKLDNSINIVQVKINSLTPNHHQISLTTKADHIGGEIARMIVNQGLELQEMKRSRPTLEDVFLELITEESIVTEEVPYSSEEE
ncbi:MAG: ABC transporter ATP-binding protein [Microcystaceae cyanobacterium]